MAKEVQNSRSGEMKKTAEDLDDVLNKVRKGARVSNDEILAFTKLFNYELTLDNISRPRLVNMCKYMGITPYGTDAYLRFMPRKRLQKIKEDDKLIQAEGVESLSEVELREDYRERGMLGLTSVQEMQQQVRPEEAVQATLSSLPDEVVEIVGVTSLPSEDYVSERRRKLEFLEKEEELIKVASRHPPMGMSKEMTTTTHHSKTSRNMKWSLSPILPNKTPFWSFQRNNARSKNLGAKLPNFKPCNVPR